MDWSKTNAPARFWKTRIRHKFSEQVLSKITRRLFVAESATGRVTHELEAAAKKSPADLFIGRGIPALSAVVNAAQSQGCPAGFDAEDYLSKMWLYRNGPNRIDSLVEFLEEKYLPQCKLLYAASPLIAERYKAKLGRDDVGCILNVFPEAQRPPSLPALASEKLTLYWFSQTIGRDRGLETVVEAMGMISKTPVELHLRGDWQPGFDVELNRLARQCGLGEGRVLSHPASSPDSMVRLASDYHVGLALEQPVSVNRDICLTNKIFTYMLAGNAIIATKTAAQTQLAERLKHGVFLIAPTDAAQLAKQLERWHQTHDDLCAARARSWELGSTLYNWEAEKAQFLKLVQNTLGNSS